MHNLHALVIPILHVEIKIIISYKTLKVYSHPNHAYYKMYFGNHEAVCILWNVIHCSLPIRQCEGRGTGQRVTESHGLSSSYFHVRCRYAHLHDESWRVREGCTLHHPGSHRAAKRWHSLVCEK